MHCQAYVVSLDSQGSIVGKVKTPSGLSLSAVFGPSWSKVGYKPERNVILGQLLLLFSLAFAWFCQMENRSRLHHEHEAKPTHKIPLSSSFNILEYL